MVVVVYRKGKVNKKRYMTVFRHEISPDRIINMRARKPMIPNSYQIDEIGVGKSFINEWKEKYNIKNHLDS